MTELPWTAKRYLSAVRRQLDAPPGDKEQLMERLHRAVSTYLEENETAGLDALAAAFGQPEVCAASLLSEINPVEVAAVRDRRKRRQRPHPDPHRPGLDGGERPVRHGRERAVFHSPHHR